MTLDSGVIRSLVREVLAEELARFKAERGGRAAPTAALSAAGGPREESVRIGSDGDLAAFVQRMLSLAGDSAARREIEAGRWVFRLEANAGADPAGDSDAVIFEKGLISERWIDALPPTAKYLRVGRAVHFTPLARDRARQRGLTIERMR